MTVTDMHRVIHHLRETFVTAGGGTKKGEKTVPGEDFTIRLWKMPAVLSKP